MGFEKSRLFKAMKKLKIYYKLLLLIIILLFYNNLVSASFSLEFGDRYKLFKHKYNKFVLLPENENIYLYLIDKNSIKKISKVDISIQEYLYSNIFINEKGLITIMNTNKIKMVKYYEKKNSIKKVIEEKLNEEVNYECLLMNNNFLFLGGQDKKSRIPVFIKSIINKNKLLFKNVELPKKVLGKWKKGIDDFFICNNTLYVIDNIMLPKYIIKFKILNNAIQYDCVKDLKPFTTYEKSEKAICYNDNYFIFSRGQNYGRDSHSISVYSILDDKVDCVLSFRNFYTLSNYKDKSKGFKMTMIEKFADKIIDFTVLNDYLIFGKYYDGLGMVNVPKLKSYCLDDKNDKSFHLEYICKLHDIKEAKKNVKKIDLNLDKKTNILKLINFSNNKIIVILEKNKKLSYRIVKIK